jgi:glycerol-3-phosphate acyltransferase PlsY
VGDVVVTVLVGYLVGSVPAAYLVARLSEGVDVRHEGEGNVGARNVFHVVGPAWGIATFAADFAKGAVVAALFRSQPAWQVALAGVAVLVGHAYPVWLRFIGGKGLSTAGGFTAVLMPWPTLIGAACSGIAWAVSRTFLPTTVVGIVATIVAAPLVGVGWPTVATVIGLFALTGVKRALDEGRMRDVEAATGWNRDTGLRA